MKITCDPAKRARTLEERGIDFLDAALVFRGRTLDVQDMRADYGEVRMQSIGHLEERMMMVVWTQRGDARHVISMRKCNDREQARYAQRFEED